MITYVVKFQYYRYNRGYVIGTREYGTKEVAIKMHRAIKNLLKRDGNTEKILDYLTWDSGYIANLFPLIERTVIEKHVSDDYNSIIEIAE